MPLLVVVLLTKFEGKEWVGLGVFLLASLTDFLDGFIARRKKQVTQLGKLLDPAADKLLTSAAFISLVELGLAPAWMVVVIIAREFAVSSLRVPRMPREASSQPAPCVGVACCTKSNRNGVRVAAPRVTKERVHNECTLASSTG